jgi:hypothetical protein
LTAGNLLGLTDERARQQIQRENQPQRGGAQLN